MVHCNTAFLGQVLACFLFILFCSLTFEMDGGGGIAQQILKFSTLGFVFLIDFSPLSHRVRGWGKVKAFVKD
jgi:hypothetical protein